MPLRSRFLQKIVSAGRWLTDRNGRWLLAVVTVFILTRVFSANRGLTETVYSRIVYPVLAVPLGLLSDIFPFSLQEMLLFAFFLYAIGRALHALWKKQQRLRELFLSGLRRIAITLSLLYCLFYLIWGFNYFRLRLVDSADFNPEAVNTANLKQLLTTTIRKANRLVEEKLPERQKISAEIEKNLTAVIKKITGQSFRTALNTKEFMSGYLAKVGVNGICLPLLQEAHIASDLLPFEQPFIIAHEKAHLKGRTSEAEANYFAWKACLSSRISAVRYSGHFSLLPYLIQSLPKEERMKWVKSISPGVLAHFKLLRERNRKRSRLLSKIVHRINHVYLKANRVTGGSRNYSHVVKLALGYRTE